MNPCEHSHPDRKGRIFCRIHSDLVVGHNLPIEECDYCQSLGPPPNDHTRACRQALHLVRVFEGARADAGTWPLSVDESAAAIADKNELERVIVRGVRAGKLSSAQAMQVMADHCGRRIGALLEVVEAAGEAGEPLADVLEAAKKHGL